MDVHERVVGKLDRVSTFGIEDCRVSILLTNAIQTDEDEQADRFHCAYYLISESRRE